MNYFPVANTGLESFPFNKLKNGLLLISYLNMSITERDLYMDKGTDDEIAVIFLQRLFLRLNEDLQLIWLYQHSEYPQKYLILNKNNKMIESIDCSNKRLNIVPNISIFPNLVSLDLSDNRLTFIPSFEFCKKLEILDLRNNQLIDISNLRCPSLELLDLRANKGLTIDSLAGVQFTKIIRLLIFETSIDSRNLKNLYPNSIIVSTMFDYTQEPDDTWDEAFEIPPIRWN